MKHLLTLLDLSKDEILSLLNLAVNVKNNPEHYASLLVGKCIILLFEKTSTRTRISFENGMYQLGGNVIYLDKTTTNLHLGSLEDEIKVMSEYVDIIMARVYKQETLERMMKVSSVPVINGLSDLYHPCQVLSDLMTIKEVHGSFQDLKITWVGDGNNVCNSLIIGCALLDIPISVATPPEYRPYQGVLDWVKTEGKRNLLKLTTDPKEAVLDCNYIYTDTFVSMGQEQETESRLKIFKPYQINRELLSNAKKNPYIMHCMPVHRGVEIADELVDSERSIIFQQAINRMFLQKALMLRLLEKA